MFCNNCGTELQEGITFCPNCGSKVGDDAPQSWEDAKTVVWDGNDKKEQVGGTVTEGMAATGETEAAGASEIPAEETNAAGVSEMPTEETNTYGVPVEPAHDAGTNAAVAGEMNAAGTFETPNGGMNMAGAETANMGIGGSAENVQRKFCPNCGKENGPESMFCEQCGMPFGGPVYGMSPVGPGMQAGGQMKKSRKGLWIGLGVAAAVLVVVIAIGVAAASGLFMGTNGKVLKAVTDTMNDSPQIVKDVKVISDILTGSQYTVGFTMEYDGDSMGGEFRNAVNDKQIYFNTDMGSADIDFLCGVHSGVLKMSLSDLDYLFLYDPKRDNDGYLCDQFRKKEVEEFNEALESITTERVSAKEMQKDIAAAFTQEFKNLEFKEVKAKEFEVDKKDRECKGYKIKINEKNVARVLEDASERISKRIDKSVVDDFEDLMDELIDAVNDDDFDMDITFYLYKNKLAAVVFGLDNYIEEEIRIEFLGGDYRMQNMLIVDEYDGDVYEEIEINCSKKGSKETIEIDVDGDEDIAITYDTKSGAVSLEYDDGWSEYLIEGTYKHSGSEASFTLTEFEYDGDSLVEDEDIAFTMYVKKAAEIGKYTGSEFDLGSADEDDFEDLMDDLEDYFDMVDDLLYGSSSAPAAIAEEAAADAAWY